MSSLPNLTLVVFCKAGETDEQIWKQVRSLGISQWRAQILVVDPNQSIQNGTERITYRPVPHSVATVADAIRAAKYETVLIVDRGFEVSPHDWLDLAEQLDDFPIQVTFRCTKPTRKLRRISSILHAGVSRATLRTAKHELRNGATVVRRSIALEQIDSCTPSQLPEFEASQLIALCRVNGHPIRELADTNSKFGVASKSQGLTSFQYLKRSATTIRFWWNSIMFPINKNQIDAPDKNKPWQQHFLLVLLIAIAIFILFGRLNFPLFEPDEARNAQLALNVVQSNDWLSLQLNTESYWDKPPLQIWAIAASYTLLGESPMATRFPIAVASFLTVLLTFLLGRKLVGNQAAIIGAFLLLLSSGFVTVGRYVTMDATLTLATTMTWLTAYLAIQTGKKKYMIAAGVACGIGLLAKGPIIAVLCIPPLLLQMWLRESSSPKLKLKYFFVPTILIAAPWFIATAWIHPDFVGYFFWKHHVVRFSEAFNHREPFWYYMVGIFLFMFPASYLLPSVSRFMFSRRPENRLVRTKQDGFLLLTALWTLLFFSVSESKLPTYILPAFPMICLMMGAMLHRKIFQPVLNASAKQPTQSTFLTRLVPRVPIELVFWCVVCGIASWVFLKSESPNVLLIVAGVIGLTGLAGIAARKSHAPNIAWSIFAILGFCFVYLGTHHLVPSISNARSIQQQAKQIQQTSEFQSAPIVYYGRDAYGSSLLLGQSQVVEFATKEIGPMLKFVSDHPRAIIVSSKDSMELLRSGMPWSVSFEKNSRHIYLSRPTPDLDPSSRVAVESTNLDEHTTVR